MNFFGYIRSVLISITQWAVYWALRASTWNWPLDELFYFFKELSDFTAELSGYFYDASNWYDWVAANIGEGLSWSTIWDLIISYVPNLVEIRDWFYYWWEHVRGEIDTWWATTMVEVQGWISSAQNLLQTQLNSLSSWVSNIQAFIDELELDFPDVSAILAWFTDWQGHIHTYIHTWWSSALLEVQSLINSAFIERESWWAGWSEFRDQVAAFFTDPLEFIWSRFTDWFLGPEE